jgi:hypothetical protein
MANVFLDPDGSSGVPRSLPSILATIEIFSIAFSARYRQDNNGFDGKNPLTNVQTTCFAQQ